jgi:hypothetical protein
MNEACPRCQYVPWPCASCGVPRCACPAGLVYVHWINGVPQNVVGGSLRALMAVEAKREAMKAAEPTWICRRCGANFSSVVHRERCLEVVA